MNNLNDNNLKNLDAFKGLSDEEKALALQILSQMASTGESEILDDLKFSDFDEIPVDIDTFLDDDRYLGKGLWAMDKVTGERKCTLFPYWRETLHKLFPDNLTTSYNTLILTGCLAYDTEIPLLNGKIEKIGELAKKENLDEYVYSYDIETNQYVPGHLIKAFSTGIKPVYEIELDNGTKIKATPNHKFMTRDKHWKSIDSGLAVGDSMMPFNTHLEDIANRPGYEVIENPNKDGTSSPIFTHRLVMNWKRGQYKGVVHHKDFNKRNNDPRNLVLTDWATHRHYHAKKGGIQFKAFNKKRRDKLLDPELEARLLKGAKKGRLNRWAKPEEHQKMSKLTTNRMINGFAKQMANQVWQSASYEKNARIVTDNIVNANKANVDRYQIKKAIKISSLAIIDSGELTEATYTKAKLDHNMRTGYPSFRSILKRISCEELYQQALLYNHKIKSIKFIGNEEVFDLTVEKYHNFAINKGIIAHNSIGLGKTQCAVLAMLYLLYRMLCLKDPYGYYGMMPIDKITFSLLNITIGTAKGVAWDKLQQLIQNSEWFMSHGSLNASRVAPTWQPDKHIELIFGSSNNHVIGRALFVNMSDEVNFSAGNLKNVEAQKKKLRKMIAQIDARMVSRFGKGTFLPTLNIIISSKDTEQSFLDDYIKRKANDDRTLTIDEPQWTVRPDKGTPDDPGAFYVAVGGKMLAHELLPVDADEAMISAYRDKGYQLIKIPPIFRRDFETNLDQALMDIAGISSVSATKFLSGARLKEAKTTAYENPFIRDVIEVGDAPDDVLQYANFFDLSKVSPEDKAKPLFIHLDMSTGSKGKGDKTGIAGVWITGKTPSVPGQDSSLSLHYKLAFSVSIKAPKGYNISFVKNQNFIKWLRDQGFAVKVVSADTFQSAAVLQELALAGFKTQIQSVDRVNADKICFPGNTRLSTPTGAKQINELVPMDDIYSYDIDKKQLIPAKVQTWMETAKTETLLKITLADNNVILCTPDHRILTTRGYIKAKDLAEPDKIVSINCQIQ